VPPDSTSWRIFKNPIALLVAAWLPSFSSWPSPPCDGRVEALDVSDRPHGPLRRTGLAAMVTVYGARSIALPMIEGVVRMHARVVGETPAGEAFTANDTRTC